VYRMGLLNLIKKHRLNRRGLEPNAPSFPDLFPEDAAVTLLASGFVFTEGPVWLAEKSCLLFSDIPGDKIYRLASDGHTDIFRDPGGNPNGLTLDRQGRLIACEHRTRRVTRTAYDGSIQILADAFQGKKLNSPNDVVVKSDGAIYFTDPPYGIATDDQEQPVQGVYRLVPDIGNLTLAADDFDRPNGLAFSPDEKKLYIDDSSKRRHIRVFDVLPDGSLANGKLFCDMNVLKQGSPDGMKIDQKGDVFCTGPGGIWVISPDGRHLGTIVLHEQPSNCAWGDDDLRSLYITARTSVYKMRVNTPGIPVF
jgi:gluconolactonase